MSKATVIIQARMGSTRLPGKSLAKLGPTSVIDWVVTRAAMAERCGMVIVATSTNHEDDVLAEHVTSKGWLAVRGSPTDVLARYVDALEVTDSPYIVRVTGDCPFVQPALIDQAIATAEGLDYVATDPDGRFPRGFDVEAIRRETLLTAGAEATDPLDREHVTPFIVRRPDRFDTAPLVCPEWARAPDLRLTLDEPADLRLLQHIVDEFDATPASLDGPAVISFLQRNPEIAAINASVRHNIIY